MKKIVLLSIICSFALSGTLYLSIDTGPEIEY